MRVRFRGITVRELALIDGPAGWGEFGAFIEYGPLEAAHWLASAIEAAYETPPASKRDRIPINATVPAVARARADRSGGRERRLERGSGGGGDPRLNRLGAAGIHRTALQDS